MLNQVKRTEELKHMHAIFQFLNKTCRKSGYSSAFSNVHLAIHFQSVGNYTKDPHELIL